MSRPRMVAVVSAVVSSTAAFMVLTRLQLVGTLAGAVLVPAIVTLVGHWSDRGLDRAGRWVRTAAQRGGAESAEEAGEAGATPEPRKAESTSAEVTETEAVCACPSAGRRRLRRQWLPATCAALALAVSVYSVVAPGPVEKVVVQERVVERTVTVTVDSEDLGSGAPTAASLAGEDSTGDTGSSGTKAATATAGAAQVDSADGDTAQGDTTQETASQTGAAPESAGQAGPDDPAIAPVETTQPTVPPGGGAGGVPTTVPEPAVQDPEPSVHGSEAIAENPAPAGPGD